MKKNNRYKRVISEDEKEVNIIWDKLKSVFEEHGALNSFKIFLEKTMSNKYDDLASETIIETLLERDRSYSYRLYVDSSHIKQIAEEIQYDGYELVKIDTLAQQYKFEAFMSDMEENPCQLKLIA